MVMICVDNVLITGDNNITVQALVDHLNGLYVLKDLGDSSYFIGVEVHNSKKGMHLSQHKYVHDLFDSKVAFSPMASGKGLSKFDGVLLAYPIQYRSIIGALQYCIIT